MLEAQFAAQPADIQAYVWMVRRRMRYLRWAALAFMAFFSLLVWDPSLCTSGICESRCSIVIEKDMKEPTWQIIRN
jgi:hypothetical protein